MREVSKIYFLFHPVCWACAVAEGRLPSGWQKYLETEKRVRQRQDELIASMKADELLILFPIYSTMEPMRRLEQYAQQTLGERLIVIQTEAPGPGGSGWMDCLPDEIQREVAQEIIEACMESGYDWSARALKVAYTQRAYALEIRRRLQERGLAFDPETVQCEAFGESFEGCAMTWKSMLTHYLGLAKPIENNFELSVADAPGLFGARFRERLALGGDVRLFLWEGADGRPIGLYARASAQLRDRQLLAHIRLGEMRIGARDAAHRQWWPPAEGAASPVTLEGDVLQVPVYAATRKTALDSPYYLIGENVSLDDFHERLAWAAVGE